MSYIYPQTGIRMRAIGIVRELKMVHSNQKLVPQVKVDYKGNIGERVFPPGDLLKRKKENK